MSDNLQLVIVMAVVVGAVLYFVRHIYMLTRKNGKCGGCPKSGGCPGCDRLHRCHDKDNLPPCCR